MARLVAERRDLEARAARDRLANMLGIHPRDLGALASEVAVAMSDHLNRINRRIQQLVDQAAVDELTGALRRSAGMEALEREIKRARRFSDRRLVVAFIDVNDLKSVNDSLGHTAGDKLLRELTRALRARLRAYDLILRWGGDEFVCVLPEAGLRAAERILAQVSADFSMRTRAAFNVGLAEIGDEETGIELVARADAALYATRRQTRAVTQIRPNRAARLLGLAGLLGVVAAVVFDLSLAVPGSAAWAPHDLVDSIAVATSQSSSAAELDLARERVRAASKEPAGPARQAWLKNAGSHLAAAGKLGADPGAAKEVQDSIDALKAS